MTTNKFLILILCLQGCSSVSREECSIDLATRRIDGVNFTGSLTEIKSRIGKNSLEILPHNLMSDQSVREIDTIWVISISGHKFLRFSEPQEILIEDSIFRTSEGVGVGSTIQEFVNHYGTPKFIEQDIGYTLVFRSFGLILSVYITPECQCGHDFASLDKKCKIINMFIIAPA